MTTRKIAWPGRPGKDDRTDGLPRRRLTAPGEVDTDQAAGDRSPITLPRDRYAARFAAGSSGKLLLSLLPALLLVAGPAALGQQAGESVRLSGDIAEDTYAAGGVVDALANIDGDLVVAGGRVTVGERVGGDLIAAGGSLTLNARIDDDLRAAGGDIYVGGEIGDDAILAGGNIVIDSDARIQGRAWLAGGRIDIRGAIGRELKVSAGKIVISGTVAGDVVLTGDSISLLDSAVIDGSLTYRSPNEADFAGGATVRGDVSYERIERPVTGSVAATAVIGIGLLTLLSLLLSGGLLYAIGPGFVRSAVSTSRNEPWKCLALGLAVFAATPVVVGIAFTLVIGFLPALVIGAAYLILLFGGFLAALFLVGDIGFGNWKRDQVSTARRLTSFAAALVILLVLGLVPIIGTLLWFALLLLGTGAASLVAYRFYTDLPR